MFLLLTAALAAPDCTAADIADLLAPPVSGSQTVQLGCNATLAPGDVVTRRVEIIGADASGVTLDCNGGTIAPTVGGYSVHIRSEFDGVDWLRPEDVTVRNCRIEGNIRVQGMSPNGEGAEIGASSLSLGHTERAQAAAPTRVLLEDLEIIASSTIPLYLSPGVTWSTLRNSTIGGVGVSTAVYFDAESAHNTLEGNDIGMDSSGREQVAIDGSAHNRIIGNRFSALDTGGIYLYRNCGEGGTVRHQTPSDNQIVNNIFFYQNYQGLNPSIWVASRNGFRLYCWMDNGYPFGSSEDNRDFAERNVIAQNQIVNRNPSVMIQVAWQPNYLYDNEEVPVGVDRPSGCYVDNVEGRFFIGDGEYVAERISATQGIRHRCVDGELTEELAAPSRQWFGCTHTGENQPCRELTQCPADQKIVGIRAACNLETTDGPATAVLGMPWNRIQVLRPSDVVSDGLCGIEEGLTTRSGTLRLPRRYQQRTSFTALCDEDDANGGDCKIVGQLECL